MTTSWVRVVDERKLERRLTSWSPALTRQQVGDMIVPRKGIMLFQRTPGDQDGSLKGLGGEESLREPEEARRTLLLPRPQGLKMRENEEGSKDQAWWK